jgi:RimJ/RimL family protein N-acetyltransferase
MLEPVDIAPVTLSGNTIRLEPYTESAFEEVCAAALSAPEIFRYIPSRIATREDVEARFAVAMQVIASKTGVFFLTRDIRTGDCVGSTSSIVTDAAHRRLEIGFTWLLPRAQRTGANTEAKYLQLSHAFDELGCIRVEFKTDARNTRSRTAIERIGAKEEGTLRSHMLCWDGHRRDSVYFSILDTEWPTVKSRLEEMIQSEDA